MAGHTARTLEVCLHKSTGASFLFIILCATGAHAPVAFAEENSPSPVVEEIASSPETQAQPADKETPSAQATSEPSEEDFSVTIETAESITENVDISSTGIASTTEQANPKETEHTQSAEASTTSELEEPHRAAIVSPEETPGFVEGEGSLFKVQDSEYLDVSVASSEHVKLRLESTPNMVVFRLESATEGATSTKFTLSNLVPNKIYYKYEDNFHNIEVIRSDENGTFTYAQDISVPHRVFIQTKRSTKFINDLDGGDCSTIGIWEAETKTCVLTADLTETIQIDSEGVTLDGAGHSLTGFETGTGVYVNEKSGAIIKNITITKFTYGVFFADASHGTLASTSIFNTQQAVTLDEASRSIVERNEFINNVQAVVAFNVGGAMIRSNTVVVDSKATRRYQGFVFFDSFDSRIEKNRLNMNDDVIQGVQKIFASRDGVVIFDSTGITVVGNTFTKFQRPLALFNTYEHEIYNNNFLQTGRDFFGNRKPISITNGGNNIFSLPLPEGGNHFDLFNTSDEGCTDDNANGVCDASYTFVGGEDAAAWVVENGWENPPNSCSEPGSCASNVLFLPGIQGSRLYEGEGCGLSEEEKLWEPFDGIFGALAGKGDEKMRRLFLDEAGKSVCTDVYVKKRGVLDTVGGAGFYQALIEQMDGLVADEAMSAWEPVAYDWRLSFDDLLANGQEEEGKIFYTKATTTPYIAQTLRALSANSKTGKVSIVAHSNGGLLAKALLRALGEEAAELVDQVIVVGAPQTGAPQTIGVTLLGHNAGIYQYKVPIVSHAAARAFAQNSPMAYHLLPSEAYVESVKDDILHPLARFAGSGYEKESGAYGLTLDTFAELIDFLLAKNGEREDPEERDLYSAEILKEPLVEYATRVHGELDAWVPPEEIEFHQIAGWGVDTVAGIDFYTQVSPLAAGPVANQPRRMYRPIFVEDGDGTVPVPSALHMSTSTDNVKRYWLDLDSYFKETKERRLHADVFEVFSLREFIGNLLTDETGIEYPHISINQPRTLNAAKKLTFYLHSPLTLQLADPSGATTGLSADGEVTQDIPGATYGQFGEVQYVIAPEGDYTLSMHGLDSGTFSLDIQESLGGEILTTTTVADVPTTADTKVTMAISSGSKTTSILSIDQNGDGEEDAQITPQTGTTVFYEEPSSTEEEISGQEESSDSGGGSSSRRKKKKETIASPIPLIASSSRATLPFATVLPIPTRVPAPLSATSNEPILLTTSHQMQGTTIVSIGPAQTASVHEAISQHNLFPRFRAAIYNGFHKLWRAFWNLF